MARPNRRDPSLLSEDPRARALVGTSIAFDTLATGALLAALALVARAVADVFGDTRDRNAAVVLLAAALACFIIRAGATLGADLLAARASRHLRTSVRADLLEALVVANRSRSRRSTGELATILADRVDALDGYVTQYVRAAAMCVIGPALVFVVVGAFDPLCLIVLAFTGPMLVFLLAAIGGRTRRMTEAREAELGWLHAFFLDMVSGLGTLKAYNRDADGATTIEAVSRRHGNATMEVLRTAFQTSLVMEWAATAATALVAVIVSLRLIGDRLSFATALTVLVLTPEFFLPFRRLALAYHAGADGTAASGSIRALRAELDTEATPAPVRAGIDLTRAAPAITLDEAWVQYPGEANPVLGPFSLRIEPGETVVLTGASGSGKTTITRLLLGLLAPTSGRVLMNGRPLADQDLHAWRDQIAWVSQHPVLVAGTIADNVRLGAPDATPAAVDAALAAADATTFIAELPNGVETVLGEGGRSLSAGQRQRVAIARAFLRDAPFIVLDEFTAHLDAESEASVLAATTRLLAGRTALVISHRDGARVLGACVVTLGANTEVVA